MNTLALTTIPAVPVAPMGLIENSFVDLYGDWCYDNDTGRVLQRVSPHHWCIEDHSTHKIVAGGTFEVCYKQWVTV